MAQHTNTRTDKHERVLVFSTATHNGQLPCATPWSLQLVTCATNLRASVSPTTIHARPRVEAVHAWTRACRRDAMPMAALCAHSNARASRQDNEDTPHGRDRA